MAGQRRFQAMSRNGDDTLILNQVAEIESTWDEEEWEWEMNRFDVFLIP